MKGGRHWTIACIGYILTHRFTVQKKSLKKYYMNLCLNINQNLIVAVQTFKPSLRDFLETNKFRISLSSVSLIRFFPPIFINANPVNLSSPVRILNQVFSRLRVEHVLSGVAVDTGWVANTCNKQGAESFKHLARGQITRGISSGDR